MLRVTATPNTQLSANIPIKKNQTDLTSVHISKVRSSPLEQRVMQLGKTFAERAKRVK